MTTANILLTFAILSALVFWALQEKDEQGRPFFKARPIIKALMAILLAVYCMIGGPAPLLFMAAGFALSALGDFFLDLPDEKHFTAGLIAFFLAHTAFLVHLWPLSVPMNAFTPIEFAIFGLLPAANIWFYLWLRPSLDKDMRAPVAAYSVIITLMGLAAFLTTGSLLIPLGAALFIASDVVLSIEKFKTSFAHAKKLNWFLYASGQIILAMGVMSMTGSI